MRSPPLVAPMVLLLAAVHAAALSDLTVLDLASWFAAPYGPSLLAELGARVIKVEPLSGDPMRQNQILAVKTQQGKESLAIDLKHPRSRGIFKSLVRMADVIVQKAYEAAAKVVRLQYLKELRETRWGTAGTTIDMSPRPDDRPEMTAPGSV